MNYKKIYKDFNALCNDLNLDHQCAEKLRTKWEILEVSYQNASNPRAKIQTYFMYVPWINSTYDIVLFSILLANIPSWLNKFVIYNTNSIIAWISNITNITDIITLKWIFLIFVVLSLSFLVPILIWLLWKHEYVTHIKYRWWFIGVWFYYLSWSAILIFTLLNLSIDLFKIWK